MSDAIVTPARVVTVVGRRDRFVDRGGGGVCGRGRVWRVVTLTPSSLEEIFREWIREPGTAIRKDESPKPVRFCDLTMGTSALQILQQEMLGPLSPCAALRRL